MSRWRNASEPSQIEDLNRIVVMFPDFAEDQARRCKQIFLRHWQTRLNEFLQFNNRNVLPNAGQVSREKADQKATVEYEHFAARRREHLEDEELGELED